MMSGGNGPTREAKVPTGVRLLDIETHRELEAFDSLPPDVRRAIAEAPFLISADQTLTAHLLGWRPQDIVRRVEEAGLQLVQANPVSDLDYEGRPLALRPRPGIRPRRVL